MTLLQDDSTRKFQQLWQCTSPTWAGKFIDWWRTPAMRSKIEPMEKVIKRIRKQIHNWFNADGRYYIVIVDG